MRYVIPIKIEPTHTSASPAVGSTLIPPGLVCNGRIVFAPGVNGTNCVRIFLDSTQIFPADPTQFYRLQTSPIEITDMYPNYTDGATLQVQGWADGANYSHRVTIMFEVRAFDVPEPV